MLWSDRVAGARRRQAVNEIGNSGGRGLPRPVRSIQDTATGPQTSDPAPVTAAASRPAAEEPCAAGSRPTGPRVEVRPEGWRLVDRRGLLKFAGAAAAAAPTASLLAACGGGDSDDGERAVRIGLVSPLSGSLRSYAEVENHVVETMNTIFVDGMRVGRNTLPVEISVRDGQSDRNRAAAAAADLIFTDHVDIVLVGGSTENANPVSDICEANGVPCISTQSPWESWFFGRGGDVQTPFSWTYHFFWGMDDLTSSYTAMWGQLDVPRRVGMLTPADQDGQTFRNASYGMPKIGQAGYELMEIPYTVGQRDFTGAVEMLKSADVPIITGVPNREDFATFWRRLNDESYLPHVVTMSKALLFPTDVDNLGSTGNGFTTEVAWSPKHPFRSFLTNQTAEELAAGYFDQTGRAWTQSLGFVHALFEVVAQALANVDSIDNARGIADAISRVTARTIVGTVAFGSTRELPKNVARIPLVGGQWQQQDNNFDLKIVNNNGINIQPEANIADLRTVQGR